jgi:nucleoside-diphosphate-sugar epimerase
MAAMEQPQLQRVLNCADGNPSEAGEVIRKAAAMLGMNAPDPVEFADADMSPMARSFYATARCVDSSQLKSALGLDLLYPDYHTGLAATLVEEQRLGLIKDIAT